MKNMKVNSSDYNLGLFGNVFDDSGSGKVNIKNITFIKPEINVSEGAMAAGVLCGAAKGVNIDNIHVLMLSSIAKVLEIRQLVVLQVS